jgi:uncharacterized integral membrane protein
MTATILLVLLIAIAAVIFGMQNNVPMTIYFLAWHFQGSVALVLIISILVGVVLGMLLVEPVFNARGRVIRELREELKNLEKEIDSVREQLSLTKDLLKSVKPEAERTSQVDKGGSSPKDETES